MLTNNYYNVLEGMIKCKNATVKAYDGSTQTVYAFGTTTTGHYETYGKFLSIPYAMSFAKTWSRTNVSYDEITFGDGNTPPSATDYKMSGNVIAGSSINVTGTSTSTTNGDGSVTVTNTYTITNISTSEITIREVALFGTPCTKTGSTTGGMMTMIDRSVLDEPVTIPANGVGQVVYSITVNI